MQRCQRPYASMQAIRKRLNWHENPKSMRYKRSKCEFMQRKRTHLSAIIERVQSLAKQPHERKLQLEKIIPKLLAC